MPDAIDRQLLKALQVNNRRTISDLCETIGLTPQTCHRRLKRLRESGLIEREGALIDPVHGARPLTVFMEFSLERTGTASRLAFEQKMRALDEITMLWAVAGKSDFHAVGQFRDLDHYYEFANGKIISDDTVRHRDTTFAINRLKFDIVVPFA